MIRSFRCHDTERIFNRQFVRRFPRSIQERAFRKLNAIDAATRLADLRLPPSNRLEPLKGNRKGQYSIRINNQWRICFVWRAGNAELALRLGRYFRQSPRFWLNLQARYDMDMTEDEIGAQVAREVRPFEAVA